MTKSLMKIVIITQEDSFAVPRNIQKIVDLDFVKVQKIVNIDSRHSLVNQKQLFVKGFGVAQAAKMAVQVFKNKFTEYLDRFSGYRSGLPSRSLHAVAAKNRIPYESVPNPNAQQFLEKLAENTPDLIVSFSAPLVFKQPLLDLPRLGCINLHCSFLPKFAGIMPSFWTLYRKQASTGVTVHYMDSKIDNGKILGQREVPIDSRETMFSLILKTKSIGGEVMCDVLKKLNAGTVEVLENNSAAGSYFTWPTVEELREFKKMGGRLI